MAGQLSRLEAPAGDVGGLDGGLDLVAPAGTAGIGLAQQGFGEGDLGAVPEAGVLGFERDVGAFGCAAGGAAGLGVVA